MNDTRPHIRKELRDAIKDEVERLEMCFDISNTRAQELLAAALNSIVVHNEVVEQIAWLLEQEAREKEGGTP